MNKFKDFFKSFLIWFAVFYLVLVGVDKIWGKKENAPTENTAIVLEPTDSSVVIGNLMEFRVKNSLNTRITFDSPCEVPGSLKVFRIANEQEFDISEKTFESCGENHITPFSLEPGSERTFALKYFNLDLFSEAGEYVLEIRFSAGEEETISVRSDTFKLSSPGILRQLFRAIVSKPLFNLLVFLTQILPTHSFGWSIVILTVFVRLLLFIPNQKAMRSQRELQKMQPFIEELKQKYGKNQQMLAMKTMELYKTHKINPMSSCLPMVFQMPFLIGVYYIVRDGLSPHLRHLLYSFQQNVDLSVVNVDFWGLHLDRPGPVILAVLVAGAQWGAVKLSLVSAKKKALKQKTSLPAKKEGMQGQMQQMNRIMLWVMPVMIGFFALSFPAGVGVYWLASTIFGIFQQKFVNWQLDKPQIRRKEG
ncbi:YidC/Oxa1 family membrane protein insertase [Candidatus Gracilibacteria bacterium]|nr:YidC/Oxa1 family membrane protein insertase [Candidatus Gracilibacteria bacterium]